MKKQTFEQWMAKVNIAIKHLSNMSAGDIPDCCYQD
jgi:hypothetical protein